MGEASNNPDLGGGGTHHVGDGEWEEQPVTSARARGTVHVSCIMYGSSSMAWVRLREQVSASAAE